SAQAADTDAEPDKDEDKAAGGDESGTSADADSGDDAESGDDGRGEGGSSSSRRRRRRRRSGEGGDGDNGDDGETTVTRVRKPRSAEDEITSIQGSTRLEAKKQRRREGREAGRRRAPIVSEAEFLARRESVERVMAIRQRKDLTQIAVLEDKVLVEHYVAREAQTSLIGNVYLGRVQNVLPSMEAAFIDIGKGRNAVLYAGEVNWSSLGHKDGEPRKIESVLQSGQTILVQVTKDPVGHKGARLTSQVSLAGRFLVYVPDGTTSGISRKLPDTERARLKSLLKEIVPESAGVIVRTAAEGASEEELTRDVERLKARWEDIENKVAKGNAPQLLYGEPDLTLKVVRDLFTEDFAKLVVQGDEAWASVREYVEHVAPDLTDRLDRFESNGQGNGDLFSTYRIDEQIAKGLDRKVWLPSGGSLIIDRTEAMTVIDVNTGKFTGSGGNLEETVTKNNLEAAEEIVRQLRLRDIGGIIVVDFIDMVLESNRDLVLRRLVECLGRDRTRHQVAEVTSLGLVQMTRKRIGTGLLEAFSENCSHCQGRGIIVHDLPVEPKRGGGGSNGGDTADGGGRGGRRRRGKGQGESNDGGTPKAVPSPKDIAAMAKHAPEDEDVEDVEVVGDVESAPSADAVELEDQATTEPVPAEAVLDEPVPDAAAAPSEVPSDLPAESPSEATVEERPADVVPAEDTPVAEETPVEVPAQPVAKTTVVTRTRRRAASRPAGPPAASSEEPAEGPASESAAEPAAEVPEPGAHVEHVPVKKKGARKR
ncbi:Rne/Rng family ribonuclease, partial [Nocardioides sp.]